MSGLLRALLILVLAVAIAGFGLSSLCGGVFTAVGLAQGNLLRQEYGLGQLALGCLLIGGVLCLLCVWALRRVLRRGR